MMVGIFRQTGHLIMRVKTHRKNMTHGYEGNVAIQNEGEQVKERERMNGR